jgi:hypothetical protein
MGFLTRFCMVCSAEASAADTTKAPSSKQSIQTILNKTARKCGSVMEELSFVQAIEASPWLCLEPGTIITSMIEKLDDGTVVLSSKHRRDPCFNFEDVKNSIQIYSDTVSFTLRDSARAFARGKMIACICFSRPRMRFWPCPRIFFADKKKSISIRTSPSETHARAFRSS